MRWFGERPWSQACIDTPHADTPKGELCLWCSEPIEPDADGVLTPYVALGESCVRERPMHAECFLRQIGGSYAHQRGLCGCTQHGARLDPEVAKKLEGLTKREEALLAAELLCRRMNAARTEATKRVN